MHASWHCSKVPYTASKCGIEFVLIAIRYRRQHMIQRMLCEFQFKRMYFLAARTYRFLLSTMTTTKFTILTYHYHPVLRCSQSNFVWFVVRNCFHGPGKGRWFDKITHHPGKGCRYLRVQRQPLQSHCFNACSILAQLDPCFKTRSSHVKLPIHLLEQPFAVTKVVGLPIEVVVVSATFVMRVVALNTGPLNT